MDHHLPINLYPVYRIARSRFIIQIVVQDLTQAGDISDFVRIQDIPCEEVIQYIGNSESTPHKAWGSYERSRLLHYSITTILQYYTRQATPTRGLDDNVNG